MSLVVKRVDQANLTRPRTEKNQTLKVAQDKIKPLISEGSLQRQVTILTSRSENFKESAMAFTLLALFTGAIGLINPLFLIIALGFLMGAAVCGMKSNGASREAEEAKSRLCCKETFPHEKEIEKFLAEGFKENGTFKSRDFDQMIERNSDGNLRAFSSYGKGLLDYPYEISGVKKEEGESAPDAIVRYFEVQACGLGHSFQGTLISGKMLLKKRASQMCAFLKLLGDGNNPVNTDILVGILNKNPEVTLDPMALKTGKLTTSCPVLEIGKSSIKFTVQDEEVGLYNSQHLLNPQADDKPIARYKTSRIVTVHQPDDAGNVDYSIERTFTRI